MKRRSFMPKFLFATITLLFTAFCFLNTYEVVFNRDIAFAYSLRKFEAQQQINAIVKQFDVKPEEGRARNNSPYTRLYRLQIPALSSNLYLEERRIIDGQWYQRPSLGHHAGLNKDDHGVTVDYLIYTNANWQTLPHPEQIEPGMDIKLFHDGTAVSLFKVAEKKVLPMQTTFVASKSQTRQIILLIEDAPKSIYYAYSLVLKD